MKINMYNRLVICVLLFAVACAIASCEDRGDTYKEFIPEGGTIYLGKAHSPMAFSGYQRMALSWWLSADPQVSNAKVFWNNGRDTLEIPVSSGGEPQKIEVLIDGLEEGVYRSEEHTSELQSLMRISYAVFCLKKKKMNH